jgi:hypothetical protein
MLRLGVFQEFKGDEAAVLIAADEAGIIALIDAVAAAAPSPQTPFAVHDLCEVSARYGVRLYLSAAERPRPQSTGYSLSVSGYWADTTKEKLQPLQSANSGHQYFELIPPTAVLVVSVGEYDANWWRDADA